MNASKLVRRTLQATVLLAAFAATAADPCLFTFNPNAENWIDLGYVPTARTKVVIDSRRVLSDVKSGPLLGTADWKKLPVGSGDMWRRSQTVKADKLKGKPKLTLSVFGTHVATGYTGRVTAAVYGMKVYEGDKLKLDLVPFGQAIGTGLWDRVSSRLYKPKADGGLRFAGGEPPSITPEVRARLLNSQVAGRLDFGKADKPVTSCTNLIGLSLCVKEISCVPAKGATAVLGADLRNLFIFSIDDRVRNSDVATSHEIYVDFKENAKNGVYKRNPDCWAKDIDLSCASVWNSKWKGQFCATLLTPRHVALAQHCLIAPTSTVWFAGVDGNTYSNSIIATRAVGGDVCVGLLAKDMPKAVRPAYVLGYGSSQFIPNGVLHGLPALMMDQQRHAVVNDLSANLANCPGLPKNENLIGGALPAMSGRERHYECAVSGDSGHPRFLIAGDKPVLVNMAWFGGGNSIGTDFRSVRDKFQKAIEAIDKAWKVKGDYALQPLDFMPHLPKLIIDDGVIRVSGPGKLVFRLPIEWPDDELRVELVKGASVEFDEKFCPLTAKQRKQIRYVKK